MHPSFKDPFQGILPAIKRSAFPAVVAVFGLAGSNGLANAQDSVSGWDFNIAPYLWGSGISGTVAPFSALPPAEIDASFSDIVEELDFGAMIAGSATRGDYGVFGDLQYIKLSSGGATPGPAFGNVSVSTKMTIASLAGEYVVVDTPTSELRILGGARYWNVDLDFNLSAGALPGRSAPGGDSWVDGIIGVRGQSDLSDQFYLTGWAMAGGGGSEFMGDVFGGVGYRLTERTALIGGYRYLTVDRRENDGFIYDVEQQGLVVGANFGF